MSESIVLIHGMWVTGQALEPLAQAFARHGFDCITPTLPGHVAGRVDESVGQLSLDDYADAIDAELRERGLPEDVPLLGHSMGGLLAMKLAARRKPRALILLTPAAPAAINAVSLGVLPVFIGMLGRGAFWRKAWRPSFAAMKRCAFPGLRPERFRLLYERSTGESGRAICEIALRLRPARVDLGQIQCPVYLVSCGLDRMTPAKVIRRLARRLGQATLRFWPDRGHWVVDDEHTPQMVQEIVGWLRPILYRGQNRVRPLKSGG